VAHREVNSEQGAGGLSKAAFARLGLVFAFGFHARTHTDTDC